jgi:hypothetical protein
MTEGEGNPVLFIEWSWRGYLKNGPGFLALSSTLSAHKEYSGPHNKK